MQQGKTAYTRKCWIFVQKRMMKLFLCVQSLEKIVTVVGKVKLHCWIQIKTQCKFKSTLQVCKFYLCRWTLSFASFSTDEQVVNYTWCTHTRNTNMKHHFHHHVILTKHFSHLSSCLVFVLLACFCILAWNLWDLAHNKTKVRLLLDNVSKYLYSIFRP